MKPAVLFAIFYTLGILFVPREIYLLGAILIVAFLARQKLPFLAVSLLFFVLGGLVVLKQPPPESFQDFENIWRGELVRVSGTMEGVFLPKKYESPWEEDKVRETSSGWFQVKNFYVGDQTVESHQRVFISVGGLYPLFRGQEIEAIGQLYTIHHQLHLKVRHSTGILKASSPGWLMSGLMTYQQKILKVWEEYFPEEHNALFRMLLFGEKRQDEFLLLFYRAGNAHLLAISGLHLYLLLCFLEYGLKLFRIHQRWIQFILGTFVLAGLFLLVQFSPSMSRTALMFLLVFLGTLFGRGVDPLNISAVVFMGMLGHDPLILSNAGFQLTFGAFFAIVLIASKREALFPKDPVSSFQKPSLWKKLLRLYLSGVLFSLAIQSVTTPILMFHFHQFYLWEALTGPFFVLPFQLLLFGLFGMTLGVSIFPEMVMEYYCVVLHFIADIFLEMIRFLGNVWGNHQLVDSRPEWVLLIYFIPLGLGLLRYFKTGIVLFFCWLGVFFAMPQSPPVLSFLDIGQGNMTLIQQEGKVLLYDIGSMNLGVLNSAVQSLWKRGVSHIDQCILSHGDADHYNLLVPLSRWIPITEVVMTERTAQELKNYLAPLLDTGTKLTLLSDQDQVFFGTNLHYEVLAPTIQEMQKFSRNSASLVLKMRVGRMTVAFTGDIEQEQINRVDVKADITLLPHHGSRNNDLKRWREMGNHRIVSCDYWFNYEPRPERLYTFLLGHIEFYATDDFPYYRRCFSRN